MQGLSYGVVRVDQENSLTSLTLQVCLFFREFIIYVRLFYVCVLLFEGLWPGNAWSCDSSSQDGWRTKFMQNRRGWRNLCQQLCEWVGILGATGTYKSGTQN